MHHRRSTIPALLLALPLLGALTSCGLDYRTDQINQIAAGGNEREASVDVLGARIVASSDGHGRLIGTLANNSTEQASLVSVTSDETEVNADVKGVRVRPDGRINLSEDVEIPVSGEFAAGEIIALTYEFSTGESVELNVPVMKQCFQHAEIEIPEAPASGQAGDEASPSAEPEEEHSTEGDATYSCSHETPGSDEGGH